VSAPSHARGKARGRGGREWRHCLAWLGVLAGGVLAARGAALVRGAVESLYANRLFPRIAVFLGGPARAVPASLVQIIAAVVAVGTVLGVFLASRRAIRRRSWTAGFGPPHRLIALLALIAWGFQLAWGFNYSRPPLADRAGLRRVNAEPANLSRLVRTLGREVNSSYRLAVASKQYQCRPATGASPAADPGPVTLSIDRRVVADRIAAGYGWLIPAFIGRPLPPPRMPRPLGWVLTRLGLSGFYFPFTAEATVNAALPDAEVPFVAAHEMAHQRGIAPEDEANFQAFLACRESGLAAARYSGALGAFGLAWNALAAAAPDSARTMAPRLLEAGPRADRAAIRAFWARHEGIASHVAERVNHAYLRANAQRGGIASYGRSVDLLLAYEAAGSLDPGN
jgi:hypothetical protein